MTSKQYLQKAYSLNSDINAKLQRIQRLRDLAMQTTKAFQLDVVQSGSAGDKIGNQIADLVDLENEVTEDIDGYVDAQREIAKAISMVDDNKLRILLEMRYLSFMKWDEIAVALNYTCHYVSHDLHRQALAAVKHPLESTVETVV